MVMRCVGHGMKVGVIQFIKGKWDTGERWVLEKFPELCTIKALGDFSATTLSPEELGHM